MFPAGAPVWKNNSPLWHVDGSTVPVFTGRVELEFEKSTFLPCAPRSIWVWPAAIPPAPKIAVKIQVN
jgi:hypothetical protein